MRQYRDYRRNLIMANQYINKVIYGNKTLIDLTGDTV